MSAAPPCVLHEDEHLLVVNKPAGWNTHAPAPHAGEGIYDWLRHREPRWASLAILHRLDKETSGVLAFGKTPVANRSLTEQFERREVKKRYALLTDRTPAKPEFTVSSRLARAGELYVSGKLGDEAETFFEVGQSSIDKPQPTLLHAEPKTGRTHQIRVHAAESGVPILGDTLYGGTPFARVCLHAEEIQFRHPATGDEVTFRAPVDFSADAREALRTAFIVPPESDCHRLIHGAPDGWPGWFVNRVGNYLLAESGGELTAAMRTELNRLLTRHGLRGAYHKPLNRHVRGKTPAELCPQPSAGDTAPERFTVRENGVRFELSFTEGYSMGLFLDQRDNRRRWLTGHVAAGFEMIPPSGTRTDAAPEVLNTFAYTCGFSVCAALRGARVTSLDLSRKYLDWGRRNLTLNGLDPAAHDFIFGDAFDWLRRLAKKGRTFDGVILDPPTFSQSKEQGRFQAEKDYGRLVTAALPVLRPGGVLLASTNAARWAPEDFLAAVHGAIRDAGRRVTAEHYAPQPPDFPVTRDEPAYLKTVWLRVQ